jgi:hypothetical protein
VTVYICSWSSVFVGKYKKKYTMNIFIEDTKVKQPTVSGSHVPLAGVLYSTKKEDF